MVFSISIGITLFFWERRDFRIIFIPSCYPVLAVIFTAVCVLHFRCQRILYPFGGG